MSKKEERKKGEKENESGDERSRIRGEKREKYIDEKTRRESKY